MAAADSRSAVHSAVRGSASSVTSRAVVYCCLGLGGQSWARVGALVLHLSILRMRTALHCAERAGIWLWRAVRASVGFATVHDRICYRIWVWFQCGTVRICHL